MQYKIGSLVRRKIKHVNNNTKFNSTSAFNTVLCPLRKTPFISFHLPDMYTVYYSDLATERERQLRTGRRAENAELDFRCPICRPTIGQGLFFLFERTVITAVALTFLNLPKLAHNNSSPKYILKKS